MKLGALDLDCPRCHLPLPPVPITVTTKRASARTVEVNLHPDIGEAFYRQMRIAHPWCFGGKDDDDDAPTEQAA